MLELKDNRKQEVTWVANKYSLPHKRSKRKVEGDTRLAEKSTLVYRVNVSKS